ncbi:hypothetical protein A3H38_05095 [candidate division WOR-1 bacterium RIFCSPLOWO2_02_FULL_46_20]|uniref:Membrane protein 6-pyruvoyl-tetrahydropterin synthase-related domain-containing protein n=1 Tax=candidate division WOR-1 bacterium RIFCSPLOWO2_02_FULL_46_20 TaxID=1802567 RepID=A0A1F4R4G4_UNCSA|nr:MAG: hypothetical protein A3J44_06230 [candidate division WOR-1 bacterium RIFCSPHIGHO2_02_FULL_45_12]OGC03052.1 MAG: hypothetical protein A3H38_05095 [candidate division WOR-1 bacterium RIFCSPLOWO2_02_FULL_46_20]
MKSAAQIAKLLSMFVLITFCLIYLYLFTAVILPYWRFDQFQFWDAAGHYFAAWFQRNHLFPNFSGWNPFFFGGYPQGTFYGPLYHYAIALLSFPLGLPLAFKFVTAASVAALPPAIYYLARKLKFEPAESAAIAALAMVPVAGLALANGGTLFSQFTVGLGAHAMALPLFLFYFGKLKEQSDYLNEGKLKQISVTNLLLLTLIAWAIVLSHFVVALAAAIVALVLTLNTFNRGMLSFAARHLLLVFFLSSFFLLPLAFYGKLTDNAGTILSMGFFLTIPSFFLILLGGAASIIDRESRFNQTFFTFMAIFAIMVFMDFGQIGFPMHAYRFIIFFLLLAWMLPVKLIFNRLENRALKTVFFACFIVLLGWQMAVMIGNNPRAEINNNRLFIYENRSVPYYSKIDLGKLDGRLMVLESQDPLAPRALEHLLAHSTGNYLLKGLFAESSANAGYVNSLYAKLFNVLYSPGEAPKNQAAALWLRLSNLNKLLTLFQVNYLLSEAPIKKLSLVKRVPIRSDRADFYLFKLAETKIAEPLLYQPYYTDRNNWKPAVARWFESPDPKILVQAADLPLTVAAPKDTLKIVADKQASGKLKLLVRANKNIPIFIRIAYSPRWHAYVDGKPVKIYQAAPSFMLIYGRGDIVLEYKSAWVDWTGKALTFLGLFWLGLEMLWVEQKKNGG